MNASVIYNYQSPDVKDNNERRYVGWYETKKDNTCIEGYFSESTVNYISQTITNNLMGLSDRKIVVPHDKIYNVLSQLFHTNRPKVGDIHSRYIIPDNMPNDVIQNLILRTIELITQTVRNELEIEAHNRTLTKWTTLYGDFNKHGLRQHAPIRISNKHPKLMTFNMNY